MSNIIYAYNQNYQLNIGDVYTDGFHYVICAENDDVIHVSKGDKNTFIKRCKFSDAFVRSRDIPYKDSRYERMTKNIPEILQRISNIENNIINYNLLSLNCELVVCYILTGRTQSFQSNYVVFPVILSTGIGFMNNLSGDKIIILCIASALGGLALNNWMSKH